LPKSVTSYRASAVKISPVRLNCRSSNDVAVQREQLADREPVLDADHGRLLPAG
jgi:hypothetical protein